MFQFEKLWLQVCPERWRSIINYANVKNGVLALVVSELSVIFVTYGFPNPSKEATTKEQSIWHTTKLRKYLLSFSIDLTSAKEGALDPSRPIKINGKTVPIADLPKDAYSLKVVEKSDIDVTDLVKYSANGTNNVFEVFYRGGKQGFGKGGSVGTLKLFLKIEVPLDETKKAAPVMIAPKTKFCMFCQRNIPDDSVCCPYCCQRQPSGGVAGQTKKCVNCGVMLPASARFCKSCGREQPATAKIDR